MKEKPKIKVRMTSNYGELGLLINGKAYDYVLDTAMLPGILFMLEKSPGRALAYVKRVARSEKRREDLE